MIGLAGCALVGGQQDSDQLRRHCETLLQRQALLGPGRLTIEAHHSQAGLNLDGSPPDELLHDVKNPDRWILACARSLRIYGIDGGARSVDRLMAAWDRWGASGLHRVEGDFLLVEWDVARRRLTLARAPLSEYQLYWSVDRGLVRFATLAPALGAREPDFTFLAGQFSGLPVYGTVATAFAGVSAVAPGTVTTVDADGIRTTRFWTPEQDIGPPLPDRQAAERLREALFDAVRDALQEGGPNVASHLSAGRDSSAVTAVAADLLRPRHRSVLACTAVPGAGYAGLDGRYLYDEGPAAASFAASKNNIEHVSVRSGSVDLGALLDRYNAVLPSAHGTPIGLPWWSGILELVEARGISTLLSGGAGNFTISSGGPWALPDLLRSNGLLAWLGGLRRATESPQAGWPNLLATSVRPFLPDIGDRLFAQRSGRGAAEEHAFYRGALAKQMRDRAFRGRRESAKFYGKQQRDALQAYDLADPEPWAMHRVMLRDPTADRRVVRAALSLTPSQVTSAYDRRPIYELAFADLIPPATLRQPLRGQQAADWNRVIDIEALRRSVRRYGDNPLVREMIDIEGLTSALGRWPDGICVGGPLYDLLAGRALPAISLASFLYRHWPA